MPLLYSKSNLKSVTQQLNKLVILSVSQFSDIKMKTMILWKKFLEYCLEFNNRIDFAINVEKNSVILDGILFIQ